MTVKKSFRPADLLELHNHHSGYMYEEAAERGYDIEASRRKWNDFVKKSQDIGIETVTQAGDVANFAWQNYDMLYKAWREELDTGIEKFFEVEMRAAA